MSAAPTTHDPGSPTRALAMSTIAFTTCFAVWTIFSIIGVRIKDELGLSETAFGLLIGLPVCLYLPTHLIFLRVFKRPDLEPPQVVQETSAGPPGPATPPS